MSLSFVSKESILHNELMSYPEFASNVDIGS